MKYDQMVTIGLQKKERRVMSGKAAENFWGKAMIDMNIERETRG